MILIYSSNQVRYCTLNRVYSQLESRVKSHLTSYWLKMHKFEQKTGQIVGQCWRYAVFLEHCVVKKCQESILKSMFSDCHYIFYPYRHHSALTEDASKHIPRGPKHKHSNASTTYHYHLPIQISSLTHCRTHTHHFYADSYTPHKQVYQFKENGKGVHVKVKMIII